MKERGHRITSGTLRIIAIINEILAPAPQSVVKSIYPLVVITHIEIAKAVWQKDKKPKIELAA